MIACISALSILGVVTIALLLMIHAISLEEAGTTLVRGFVALVLLLWALCALRPLLVIAFVFVKAAVVWMIAIGSALAVLGLVMKLILRFGRTNKSNGGEW